MGSLAYEAVMAHLWIEENLCKLYNYSHKLLTPLSEFHSCMWADVNCILFFKHRESGMVRLNWSKLARHLSSVGMIVPPVCNHYPSSGRYSLNASQ